MLQFFNCRKATSITMSSFHFPIPDIIFSFQIYLHLFGRSIHHSEDEYLEYLDQVLLFCNIIPQTPTVQPCIGRKSVTKYEELLRDLRQKGRMKCQNRLASCYCTSQYISEMAPSLKKKRKLKSKVLCHQNLV